MYKIVDLFAGAGGLSEGFEQTGKFKIVMAAENNKYASATYKRNHPETAIESDVRTIDYKAVRRKYGTIDLVIGGPPCQGFSNANRQKATISTNNGLVKEFVRAVKELKPAIFVMENVSMLRSDTHRFYCSNNDEQLDALQIAVEDDHIVLTETYPEMQALENQVRASLEHYQDYLWEENFSHALNILYKRINNDKFNSSWNKYRDKLYGYATDPNHCMPDGEIGEIYRELYESITETYDHPEAVEQLKDSIRAANRFQRMYKQYRDISENNINIEGLVWDDKTLSACVRSYSVLDYIKNSLKEEVIPYKISYGVLNAANYGAPQRRERFIIIGSRIGKKPLLPEATFDESNYRTVRQAIEDLANLSPATDPSYGTFEAPEFNTEDDSLLAHLRNSKVISNHFMTATRETAQERYDALKEGENFKSLPDHLKSTYSDGKRTQSTIYLKLTYDAPSPTVINIRKSMWVHPVKNRALSVREAARLQTFPDSYVFEGTKDAQYQQVGNAVPPMLANAIAIEVLSYMENQKRTAPIDQLLVEIAIDPEATQQQYSERIGVSQATVSNYIRKYIDEGKIIKKQSADGHSQLQICNDLNV